LAQVIANRDECTAVVPETLEKNFCEPMLARGLFCKIAAACRRTPGQSLKNKFGSAYRTLFAGILIGEM
jgi:hypothetical protein